MRLVIVLAVAVVLVLLSLLYAMNTQTGTAFLLDKVSTQIGANLNYSDGTLREGVWVSNFQLKPTDDIEIKIDRAFIKLGWRSLFAKQVHLVDSELGTLDIINHKAPTGEPFDYMTVDLPFTLKVDNSTVQTIAFHQKDQKTFHLRDGHIQSATWSGTRINTQGTSISYERDVVVNNATGFIDLSDSYPLDVRADINVKALDDVYFDTLYTHATGSLKRTVGKVVSAYNGYDVRGEFSVQGLDDNVPFSAKLYVDDMVLPYAEEQQIHFTDGVITAEGVIDEIEIRLNSDLTAKDIPSGRYHGRGVITPTKGMDIPFLKANTPSGVLTAKGSMDWQHEFKLHADVKGDSYQIRDVLPIEYQDYQAYLPKTLTGTLGVDYDYLDKDSNETRLQFNLAQQDGEQVNVRLAQSQDNPNADWHIHADWQHLYRTNVPSLDNIHSKRGNVHIRLAEGRTFVEGRADIDKLSVAPKGDYIIKANIEKGERIHLDDFKYQGVMGDLAGHGRIDLATKQAPLTWQFDLNTQKLVPNAYFDTPNKTPIHTLSGRLVAMGRLREGENGTTHDFDITDSDLVATLDDKKQLALDGKGGGVVLLNGSDVRHFKAYFDGAINQDFIKLGKSNLNVVAQGNLDAITIDKLNLNNDKLGTLSATGKLGLTKGIAWGVNAHLDKVDTSVISPDFKAVITGKLASQGAYGDKLDSIQASFDGQVQNDKIPQGRLNFDVLGKGNVIDIKRLSHTGQAGSLNATGKVDIDKRAWDIKAGMTQFDMGQFVRGVDSKLTGQLASKGHWKDTQAIDISGLDVHGTLNGQPLTAKGSLSVLLDLPKNLDNYVARLKQTAHTPKSPNELIDLQKQLHAHAYQTRQIIKHMTANDLSVQLGDNTLAMNGDKGRLTTTVSVQDLGQIVPSASGRIVGGMVLADDRQALPTLYVDLDVNDVRTKDVIVQRVDVLGKVVNLGNLPSQLAIEVDNIIALGRVVKSARLDFKGTQESHTASFATKNADLEMSAHVKGGFNGKTMQYQGVLGQGQVVSKFGQIRQTQPAEFSYTVKNNHIKIAPHCWQTTKDARTGSLCLQDMLSYHDAGANINLVVQNLDTSVLSPALPSDMRWRSVLNGKVQASWQQGKSPLINAVLYSDNGRVGISQEGGYVEMPYERVSVIAKSVPAGLKIRTDIAGTIGTGYADVVIDPYKTNKPISGAMAIEGVDLAVVQPFFPDLQTLAGMVDIAGAVGGTLTKPLFFGTAELKRGQLAVAGVPLMLSGIQADMDIQGDYAKLKGGFWAGEGRGKLTGQIDWKNSIQAQLGIMGEHLTIDSPPLLMAEFSPDIEILVKPTEQYVNVKGVISVPNATIRPPETTETIVSQSGDVTVIDRRKVANVNEILATVKPWSINADIGLDLGDNVVFRGFGAKLPLAGALHLTQSGQDSMKARGVVQVAKRATIDGIGQNLELNYAQIRFNGDMLNPHLSIEAEKQIEGQTVGVRVKGTANKPDISVFNSAGLTEQQAMNAIITGRISEANDAQVSEQSFRSQVTNNLAAAGLNLGLSGTRNITNQIGNALGLENLTVDAQGNSHDTSLNITGYISPDLYIRYGVGVFNAKTQLSMRYQLTRRVYVEATKATENMVDVIYRWKF
ncbi:translocation/assembly module TamB domain-containing protein [Moraxella oblonga]|uniref:translocation/assembly module TamB domain-containing protein n=1 Tax=Moraxella oblonga TaxID=200413 RepID=UPI00082DD750|nr:translocation/assembly module TamB domain-containing protein [Moraxella oblonga]